MNCVLYAVTEPLASIMASYRARDVKDSLDVQLQKMLFTSVSMVAIVKLICICEENVKLVGWKNVKLLEWDKSVIPSYKL